MSLKVLRTPDAAFEAVKGFEFEPRYLTINDPETQTPMRVHYVDEGPRDAPIVLMLHGEPTWSYLYRHMIGPQPRSRIIAMPAMLHGCANGLRPWI